MTHIDKPIQISSILKTLGTRKSIEISDELEKYVMDREAWQPVSPESIVTLLKPVGSQLHADKATSLEARRQVAKSEDDQIFIRATDDSPKWSHERRADRDQYRRARASKRPSNHP